MASRKRAWEKRVQSACNPPTPSARPPAEQTTDDVVDTTPSTRALDPNRFPPLQTPRVLTLDRPQTSCTLSPSDWAQRNVPPSAHTWQPDQHQPSLEQNVPVNFHDSMATQLTTQTPGSAIFSNIQPLPSNPDAFASPTSAIENINTIPESQTMDKPSESVLPRTNSSKRPRTQKNRRPKATANGGLAGAQPDAPKIHKMESGASTLMDVSSATSPPSLVDEILLSLPYQIGGIKDCTDEQAAAVLGKLDSICKLLKQELNTLQVCFGESTKAFAKALSTNQAQDQQKANAELRRQLSQLVAKHPTYESDLRAKVLEDIRSAIPGKAEHGQMVEKIKDLESRLTDMGTLQATERAACQSEWMKVASLIRELPRLLPDIESRVAQTIAAQLTTHQSDATSQMNETSAALTKTCCDNLLEQSKRLVAFSLATAQEEMGVYWKDSLDRDLVPKLTQPVEDIKDAVLKEVMRTLDSIQSLLRETRIDFKAVIESELPNASSVSADRVIRRVDHITGEMRSDFAVAIDKGEQQCRAAVSQTMETVVQQTMASINDSIVEMKTEVAVATVASQAETEGAIIASVNSILDRKLAQLDETMKAHVKRAVGDCFVEMRPRMVEAITAMHSEPREPSTNTRCDCATTARDIQNNCNEKMEQLSQRTESALETMQENFKREISSRLEEATSAVSKQNIEMRAELSQLQLRNKESQEELRKASAMLEMLVNNIGLERGTTMETGVNKQASGSVANTIHPQCDDTDAVSQSFPMSFRAESETLQQLKALELPIWSRTTCGAGRSFWLLYASGDTAPITTIDQAHQLRIENTLRDVLGSSGFAVMGHCISREVEITGQINDCGKTHFSACAACVENGDVCIVRAPAGFVVMPRATKEKNKWIP